MNPYYEQDGITIYHGDCRDFNLSGVSAIITDPPYGLKFMGKDWDHGIPGVHFWEHFAAACLPGAHLLAFGGTRTHHRLMCAIEDAGWEMRDALMWLYGSGFPKSLDVSKAIDKAAGTEFERLPASGVGFMNAEGRGGYNVTKHQLRKVGESIDAAKQWDGWGTALKPAWEPIVLARKPLVGTVAQNVQEHGTGALNIDGCRIDFAGNADEQEVKLKNRHADFGSGPRDNKVFGADNRRREEHGNYNPPGRWPANLVLDEESAAMLDEQSGERASPWIGNTNVGAKGGKMFGGSEQRIEYKPEYRDTGGASRFFYCAKASRSERGENNNHPTVKPLDLMTWLCTLVTPPGGLILDPFMGSGSTLLAAQKLGFWAIGIELEERYCEIATQRLSQGVLAFGGV